MKVCNCAECGVEVSKDIFPGIKDPRFPKRKALGGRIHGRPYCHGCLSSTFGIGGRAGEYKGEPSPGWENMIKVLEDGLYDCD